MFKKDMTFTKISCVEGGENRRQRDNFSIKIKLEDIQTLPKTKNFIVAVAFLFIKFGICQILRYSSFFF